MKKSADLRIGMVIGAYRWRCFKDSLNSSIIPFGFSIIVMLSDLGRLSRRTEIQKTQWWDVCQYDIHSVTLVPVGIVLFNYFVLSLRKKNPTMDFSNSYLDIQSYISI